LLSFMAGVFGWRSVTSSVALTLTAAANEAEADAHHLTIDGVIPVGGVPLRPHTEGGVLLPLSRCIHRVLRMYGLGEPSG
jgi:hypothetical protein